MSVTKKRKIKHTHSNTDNDELKEKKSNRIKIINKNIILISKLHPLVNNHFLIVVGLALVLLVTHDNFLIFLTY